ncbi:MAG TPA: S8 family serine peptidase [Acidimicrobiia bacterium]|nr:S8 family serine peptidase [Acidimicrobiia bacterium]
MLRRWIVAVLVLSLGPVAMSLTSTASGSGLLGNYIVVLKDSANANAVAGTATSLGATVDALFGSINTLVVSLPLLNLGALQRDPRVAFVTPDRPVHLLSDGVGAAATAAVPTPGTSGVGGVPTGVMRIGAAPLAGVAGPAKKAAVAVVDTGIMLRPDLNVVGGYDCAHDLLGDLLGGGGGATKDNNGHGTHVAGIIGARDTGQGVVGVSPGTPLYAVRVFSSFGSGSLSNVICGLNWVAQNAAADNIRVVNMSLGGQGSDDGHCGTTDADAFHAAVCRVNAAGVTVVVAAGNDGADIAKTVPASYDETLAVTAMTDFDGRPGGLFTGASPCSTKGTDDTAASFSDYAVPGSPDAGHVIAAPGVCITSTWNDGGFKTISGTSMASPHVAGLVARCIDAGPCAGLTPAQIGARLRADAAARPADQGFAGDPHHPVAGKYYGDLADDLGY